MPAEEQVSFVGELSLATACAFSCNCNGFVGYEVMFLEGSPSRRTTITTVT